MKKLTAVLLTILFVSLLCFNAGCKNKEDKNVSAYKIDCVIKDNFLEGEEQVTFYNSTDNAFTELKFNLFPNAFREDAKNKPIRSNLYYKAYPNGVNYGNIEINSVTDGKDDLEFYIGGEDENILVVKLKEEVYPQEKTSVTIAFNVKLANVIARTGVNDKTINLGNFYPILCGLNGDEFYECVYYQTGDPFFSDTANYQVSITTPKEKVVASSGKLVKEHVQGEEKTSIFTINNARSFCLVVSNEFNVLEKKVGKTTIKYYYYEDEFCEQNADVCESALSYFNQTFGEYPYETFSVVKTPFIEGGMEYPGLVYIQDGLPENQYKEVIVHETAHQWWQSVVGNNEIEQGFLDEGLAEYSVILFYDAHKDYGYTRKDLISACEKSYKSFCSVYDKVFKNVNTTMNRSLKDFTSDYEYVNIAYVKPCIMYDYFRTTVGEEKFFKGLKKFYEDYKFKNTTIDDLIACFNKVGCHAEGYFESFVNGKAVI